MKLVFFDPFRQWDDVATALRAFSGIEFVHPPDNAGLAAALAGAEVLVTGNRSYVAETAAMIREQRHGAALDPVHDLRHRQRYQARSAVGRRASPTWRGCAPSPSPSRPSRSCSGLVRKIRETEAARQHEDWARDALIPVADNLAGKHLVIIGLGAIGQDVARKAKAFDMQVTGGDPLRATPCPMSTASVRGRSSSRPAPRPISS